MPFAHPRPSGVFTVRAMVKHCVTSRVCDYCMCVDVQHDTNGVIYHRTFLDPLKEFKEGILEMRFGCKLLLLVNVRIPDVVIHCSLEFKEDHWNEAGETTYDHWRGT